MGFADKIHKLNSDGVLTLMHFTLILSRIVSGMGGKGVLHLLGQAPCIAAKMKLQPNNGLNEF